MILNSGLEWLVLLLPAAWIIYKAAELLNAFFKEYDDNNNIDED